MGETLAVTVGVAIQGVWVLPDGTRQIIPKDEGQGVMLSGLCSRELGYGFPISKAHFPLHSNMVLLTKAIGLMSIWSYRLRIVLMF